MAKRPIKAKQVAKLRKALRRGRLDSFIDLVEYLVDRRMAKSKREARELILAKRVRVDSHPLGVKTRKEVPAATMLRIHLGLLPHGKLDDYLEDVEYVDPVVPADVRGRVYIAA
jgi:ribosomal 50S subunit-recycling heat shock protein